MPVLSPRTWKLWDQTLGSQRASQFWVYRLDPLNTSSARWMSASPRSVRICSVAWQLSDQSANPRANHTIRTMQPSQSAVYCRTHDVGIWHTARELLEDIPSDREAEAQQLSTLPMRIEVWVCGLLNVWHQLHFGPPGQTQLP